MKSNSEMLAILAAILISGTTHTPEEGIAKAQELLALAESTKEVKK